MNDRHSSNPRTRLPPPRRPQASAKVKSSRLAPVTARNLGLFFRQLATMERSGVALSQSLHLLEQHLTVRGLRRIAVYLRTSLDAGSSLHQSMQRYPHIFPPVTLALVTVGEKTGKLEECFLQLALWFEHQVRMRAKILSAMTYPVFVAIAGLFIMPVPMFFQPDSSMTVMDYFSYNLLPLTVLAVLIFAGAAFRPYLHRSRKLSRVIDTAFLSLPIYGMVARRLAISRFCRTFADAYNAGLTPDEIFPLAIQTVANRALTGSTRVGGMRLRPGETFIECFQRLKFFDPIQMQTMMSGELTGRLDDSMKAVAQQLEDSAMVVLERFIKLIGPALLLVIGLFLAAKIVSFYMTYFNQISAELPGILP